MLKLSKATQQDQNLPQRNTDKAFPSKTFWREVNGQMTVLGKSSTTKRSFPLLTDFRGRYLAGISFEGGGLGRFWNFEVVSLQGCQNTSQNCLLSRFILSIDR